MTCEESRSVGASARESTANFRAAGFCGSAYRPADSKRVSVIGDPLTSAGLIPLFERMSPTLRPPGTPSSSSACSPSGYDRDGRSHGGRAGARRYRGRAEGCFADSPGNAAPKMDLRGGRSLHIWVQQGAGTKREPAGGKTGQGSTRAAVFVIFPPSCFFASPLSHHYGR
jgi:hypothetical protein